MTTALHPAAQDPAPLPSRRLDRPALPWLATAGRLALAGVFAVAGLSKIADPAASVRAVRAYELLPEGLETLVGRGLPAFELLLAGALLLGVALRLSAAIAAGLLAVFTAGIASAAARGLRIDCGCFGGGGPTDNPQYAGEIVRDAVLLAVAVTVALIGRSRWAVGPRPPAAPDPAVPARTAVPRAAAARERYSRLQRRVSLGVVAALLVGSGSAVAIAAATAPGAPQRIPAGVTAAGGILVGQADAPRTVVVYEDPQCPICKQFEDGPGSVLTDAVETGQVRVEYRMRSFLGPESVRAVAALGAAQDAGRFADLRRALFAHQPAEHSGGYTARELIALGRGIGLTDPAWVTAVHEQTYAAWARRIDDRASRDGNTGTPQLLLDGAALPPATTFDAARLKQALTG
ncbi:MAG: MauE/DoxX family redox-associated membrane protein [Sporichthyaceae bacterium]